jgi:hypothetical protein
MRHCVFTSDLTIYNQVFGSVCSHDAWYLFVAYIFLVVLTHDSSNTKIFNPAMTTSYSIWYIAQVLARLVLMCIPLTCNYNYNAFSVLIAS